jgi:hypothetical protein
VEYFPIFILKKCNLPVFKNVRGMATFLCQHKKVFQSGVRSIQKIGYLGTCLLLHFFTRNLSQDHSQVILAVSQLCVCSSACVLITVDPFCATMLSFSHLYSGRMEHSNFCSVYLCRDVVLVNACFIDGFIAKGYASI